MKRTNPQSLSRLAALLGAMFLSACASTRAPTANEGTHVAVVEVVHHDPVAAGFAVPLREAVIREAALYGNDGRPITLRIDLAGVHFKNPLLALTISDDSRAKGQVAVIDPATGQQTSTFKVRVNASQGMTGAGVAMSVIEMADPTGYVGAVHAVSNSMSATVNRSGTVKAMSENFATETLRQTFGDIRAKAVAKERKARAKAH